MKPRTFSPSRSCLALVQTKAPSSCHRLRQPSWNSPTSSRIISPTSLRPTWPTSLTITLRSHRPSPFLSPVRGIRRSAKHTVIQPSPVRASICSAISLHARSQAPTTWITPTRSLPTDTMCKLQRIQFPVWVCPTCLMQRPSLDRQVCQDQA